MEAFEKRKKYIHIPAVFVLLMILCLAYSTQIFADTTKTKVVNTLHIFSLLPTPMRRLKN